MATFTYKGASWTYNEVTGADGRIWMDRNLGATQAATSSTDTASYGDLFQWGRLDDGHQTPTSGTTTTRSSGDIPGNANFIKSAPTPYDWRNPQNDNLWKNGLNIPAPAGWRLPTQTEWTSIIAAAGITNGTTAYGSTLKLPLSGYRDRGDAVLHSQGSIGYYWSGTISGSDAYCQLFTSGGPTGENDGRAFGFTVRLIKYPSSPFPSYFQSAEAAGGFGNASP